MPENPSSGILGRAVWWDDRDLSALTQTASLPTKNVPLSEPMPEIVEATGWVINDRAQMELVANGDRIPSWQKPANCLTHR